MMNDEWQGETPIDRRVNCLRMCRATGNWEPCEFKELKCGDIFRTYIHGMLIHPHTHEIIEPGDEAPVALAEEDATPNPYDNEGYGLVSVAFDTLQDLYGSLH